MGPAVSWLCAIGMMPARLTRPSVGLRPTRPTAFDGQTIEPSVSVPTATAARLAAIALPDPELDPHGLRSSTYGLRHCPPRADQPEDDLSERMFAHSLMFVLPSRTAPAARRRSATKLSRAGMEPSSAREPAVVVMRSCVSTLSFSSTGTPCSGPRAPFVFRSASSASAMASASGFVSRTLRSVGPLRSRRSMRSRQACTSDRAVRRPSAIAAWMDAMVASSTSKGASAAAAPTRPSPLQAAAPAAPICRNRRREVRARAPRRRGRCACGTPAPAPRRGWRRCAGRRRTRRCG